MTEIFAIPQSVKRTIQQRDALERVARAMLDVRPELIILTGSGTSFHAGLAANYWFARHARVPTFVVLSPEFQFQVAPVLRKRHVVVVISQSGESVDAVEAAKVAKSAGALTVGVTNSPESTLAETVEHVLATRCGEEKSILATKTYVAQLAALFGLAIELGRFGEKLSVETSEGFWEHLRLIPAQVEVLLPQLHASIRKLAKYYKFVEKAFVLGAGPDFATAQEAALKLKEGARITAQAYSTAEFPHGPITLADPSAWIVAIVPHEDDPRRGPIIRLLERIKSRGATILGIIIQTKPTNDLDFLDHVVNLPSTPEDLFPLLSIIPIQLLVVEIALIKELNPDAPKWLTKVAGIDQ